MLLNDGPAPLEQRVADVRRDEARGVHFHFITHASDHRSLVAFGARIRIEQRAEAILGLKDPLKHFLALLELRALLRREIRPRLAENGRLVCLAPAKNEAEKHGCVQESPEPS